MCFAYAIPSTRTAPLKPAGRGWRPKTLESILTNDAPAPPIIVDDHGSVEIYLDAAGACAELEIYDVRKDGVQVLDTRGRRNRVQVDGYDVIGMSLDDRHPADMDYLIKSVRSGIRQLDSSVTELDDLEGLGLEAVLERLWSLQTAAAPPRRLRAPPWRRLSFGQHGRH